MNVHGSRLSHWLTMDAILGEHQWRPLMSTVIKAAILSRFRPVGNRFRYDSPAGNIQIGSVVFGSPDRRDSAKYVRLHRWNGLIGCRILPNCAAWLANWRGKYHKASPIGKKVRFSHRIPRNWTNSPSREATRPPNAPETDSELTATTGVRNTNKRARLTLYHTS